MLVIFNVLLELFDALIFLGDDANQSSYISIASGGLEHQSSLNYNMSSNMKSIIEITQ